LIDRLADIDLRRHVEDGFGPELDHCVTQFGSSDVHLVEVNAATSPGRRQTFETTGDEIVDDENFDAVVDEPIDEIGADESGAAGDEGLRNHLTSKLSVANRRGYPERSSTHRRLGATMGAFRLS
jgi:hypothetical protein